jgi:hypothetical protein
MIYQFNSLFPYRFFNKLYIAYKLPVTCHISKKDLVPYLRPAPILADLCYTFIMNSRQEIWQIWARNLHRWGLREPAAAILEISGPLNLVLAQGLYLIQPLFSGLISKDHLGMLAGVLENSEETHLFVAYLREGFLT